MIASIDCKFKTNKHNIENIFQHYGLRKIQGSLYAGDLENDERHELVQRISELVRQSDSILIMPICQKLPNVFRKKARFN